MQVGSIGRLFLHYLNTILLRPTPILISLIIQHPKRIIQANLNILINLPIVQLIRRTLPNPLPLLINK